MSTPRTSLAGLAFGAATLAAAFAVVVSCSDDPNLSPAADAAVTSPESGLDDGSPDGGLDSASDGCVSSQPRCNSCTTSPDDPYNACSSAVTNCVAFDPKRIPQGPGGGIPQVP